jgi:alpha-glucosidase
MASDTGGDLAVTAEPIRLPNARDPTASQAPRTASSPFRYGDDWWRRSVVYQIYPRSFADSDGDGMGDLPGIIDHLDHLGPGGLDVDAIWLSPFYPSGGLDGGYDVTDHSAVDPRFGTEADFDRLVAECHRRGIRVILDLVMNHTSDEHRWFTASRSARDDPMSAWYLWRDAAGFDADGRALPPNNWVSWFGGPAWTWEPRRSQFYHHTFLREQPELDWRLPSVEAAQFEMVRGWLARGADGFRLDTFNVFLKHPDMPNNPVRRGRSAWARQTHRYDIDQPDLPDLIARFRAIVDAEPGRMTVGELFVGTTEGAAALTVDRHLVFDWELLTRPWSADAFRAAIRRRERAFGPGRWPTAVLSNHDQPRHASRLSVSEELRDPIAKAAATLLLTVRGTPFLYYGEEIAMGDVAIPPEESVDPPAARAGPDFQWWDRSQSRTPMPWAAGPGAGFTTGRPWLRIAPDAATRNVAAQLREPDSVLACYRRLLAVRRTLPSVQDGSLTIVSAKAPDILAYRRSGSGPDVLVLIAFGPDGAEGRVPAVPGGGAWRPVVGTHLDLPASLGRAAPIRLRPFEAIVAVAE